MAHQLEVMCSTLFREGRFAEAAAACSTVLRSDPHLVEAHRLLGVALYQLGDFVGAVASFRQAVSLAPHLPLPHDNLSVALHALGNFQEADQSARQALTLRPEFPEALNSLGNALKAQGRLDEAAMAYRSAVTLRPQFVEAWVNLGAVLRAQGRLDESVEAYRQALGLRPDCAAAAFNLGNALRDQGRLGEAVEAYRLALTLQPTPEAVSNLGNLLWKERRLEEAAVLFRQALVLRPDQAGIRTKLGSVLLELGRIAEAEAEFVAEVRLDPSSAQAHYHLGFAYLSGGRYSAAAEEFRLAVSAKSHFAAAHSNLGMAQLAQGLQEEATTSFWRAVELEPTSSGFHSSALYCHSYRPGVTSTELLRLHTDWDARHAAPVIPSQLSWHVIPDPDRPLRLGFVSADFRRHPVSWFFMPVLENLDRRQCETICYSSSPLADDITLRIQRATTTWREVHALSDADLADCIRSDAIDFLIDLTGHAAGNRLLVFARKPAPVQATWIGSEGTTGLRTMDYIIADQFHIPEGAEMHYRETVLRLPSTHLCFDPPAEAPAVRPLPALHQARVTFGCCNNLSKLTPLVLSVWASILRRVSGSRLLLKYRGMEDPAVQLRFHEFFRSQGLPTDRIELCGWSPMADYLATYHSVDLALDPFPFSGGLTTCHALWMGVPVITCPTETFASRHTLSLLRNVGLTDFIAEDLPDYVDRAAEWAGNLQGLAKLRSDLRQHVAESALCDGRRMARDLLSVLRTSWRQWCQSPSL